MSKIYNTRKLQIAILCQFMADKHNSHYCGTGFLMQGRGYISFKEAVKMYNEHPEDDKELKQLKLTYDKKRKKIVCLNNLIKQTENVYDAIGEEGFLKVLKIAQ
ncbi:hypothetical protein FE149_RS23170 [Escherichia coli]|jgi:hypothetical protein|nr:hypothetical protein [Escherichia coli]EFY4023664.1 hypothetical protein [Shigella flexneri]